MGTFQDGCKWREEANPLYANENTVDICVIWPGAQGAADFKKKIDQRELTDVFVISVTQSH